MQHYAKVSWGDKIYNIYCQVWPLFLEHSTAYSAGGEKKSVTFQDSFAPVACFRVSADFYQANSGQLHVQWNLGRNLVSLSNNKAVIKIKSLVWQLSLLALFLWSQSSLSRHTDCCIKAVPSLKCKLLWQRLLPCPTMCVFLFFIFYF